MRPTEQRHDERSFRRGRWLALLFLCTSGAVWLWAHEGHQPLPSKGSEPIKDEMGNIIGVSLNKQARESIDVQTAEIQTRPVEERVLAYVSLAPATRKHAYASARL